MGEAPVFGRFSTFPGGKARIFIALVVVSAQNSRFDLVTPFMPYSAAKAALINLTRSLARGFAHEGITAMAIAPGFVHTEMAQAYIDIYGKEAAVGDIPLGEMVEPEEVARLIAFVLHPDQRSLVLVGRVSSHPVRIFRIVAGVALLVSFLNPIMLLAGLFPATGMNLHIFWTMIVMHCVSALITVSLLTTLAVEQ